MVGIRSFPFGAQPIFRGELLVPKRECSLWWFGLHLLVSPLGKFIQFDEHIFLGGGFKYFLVSPLFGETIQLDSYVSYGLKPPSSFEMGWLNHQPRNPPWKPVADGATLQVHYPGLSNHPQHALCQRPSKKRRIKRWRESPPVELKRLDYGCR